MYQKNIFDCYNFGENAWRKSFLVRYVGKNVSFRAKTGVCPLKPSMHVTIDDAIFFVTHNLFS